MAYLPSSGRNRLIRYIDRVDTKSQYGSIMFMSRRDRDQGNDYLALLTGRFVRFWQMLLREDVHIQFQLGPQDDRRNHS